MLDGLVVAARLLRFAFALALFGSSLFYLYGFEAGTASDRSRQWSWRRAVLLLASAGTLLGSLWWVTAQTAAIFGQFDSASAQILLTGTGFGRATLVRIGLLIMSLVVLLLLSPGRALWIAQLLLGGAIVASFAWVGHGVLDDGWAGVAHQSSDVLHLIAAGVWIGALVCLSILLIQSLRAGSGVSAYAVYRGLNAFSAIGLAVVSVLVLTGLVNGWFLISPRHAFDLAKTDYGILLVVKLCLFAAMIVLAALNRFRLTPRLNDDLQVRALPSNSLKVLRRSVIVETTLALLIIFAVSWMGTLEPPVSVDANVNSGASLR